MAETLPRTFLKTGEGAIASFDYVDIASGTGTNLFYLALAEDNTGAEYVLTDRVISSSLIEQITPVTAEYNFDSGEFNLPRTVKGTGWISGDVMQDGNGGATTWTYRFYKVTVLDAEVALTAAIVFTTPNSGGPHHLLIKCPFTQTIIKKGEKLRLSVTSALTGAISTFGIDPVGRDGTLLTAAAGATSTTIAYVPFRVDL